MKFTLHFCHKPKSPKGEPDCFSSPDIEAEGPFEAREAGFDAARKLGAEWLILSDATGKDLETWAWTDERWGKVNA